MLLTHDLRAKVADFGLATRIYCKGAEIEERKRFESDKIPLFWTAYEILQGNNAFLEKSDVWSFGVLMWEIFQLCRAIPFPNITHPAELCQILRNGTRLDAPFLCPPKVYEWMQLCWKLNHAERPNFRDLKELIDNFDVNFEQEKRPSYQTSASDPTGQQNSNLNFQRVTEVTGYLPMETLMMPKPPHENSIMEMRQIFNVS